MMGQAAPSAAPAYAIPCWVDGQSLYFELRGVNGPYVVCYQRHELSKALETLFKTFADEGQGEVYIRPPVPASTTTTPDKNGLSDAQRQAARDVLKKLRII